MYLFPYEIMILIRISSHNHTDTQKNTHGEREREERHFFFCRRILLFFIECMKLIRVLNPCQAPTKSTDLEKMEILQKSRPVDFSSAILKV